MLFQSVYPEEIACSIWWSVATILLIVLRENNRGLAPLWQLGEMVCGRERWHVECSKPRTQKGLFGAELWWVLEVHLAMLMIIAVRYNQGRVA